MESVQFMTADEKTKVLKAWARFIKGGFKKTQFSKAIYEHLTLHCSFIAHYSRHGFYEEYFVESADTLKFLGQFDRETGCKAVESGGNFWLTHEPYQDLNEAMVDALAPLLPQIKLDLRAAEWQQADSEATAARLHANGLRAAL